TGDVLTAGFGWPQRNPSSVTGDDIARVCHAADLNLETLDGKINVTGRSTRGSFFPEHMPRLNGHAQFQLQVPHLDGAVVGKAEFPERRVPLQLEGIADFLQFADDFAQILPQIMWQHESVLQGGTPTHERVLIRSFPEPRHQRA